MKQYNILFDYTGPSSILVSYVKALIEAQLDINLVKTLYDIDLVCNDTDNPIQISLEIEGAPDKKWRLNEKYPYPGSKFFTIPLRKTRYFLDHPNSFFVKINESRSQSCIVDRDTIIKSIESGRIQRNERSCSMFGDPCGAYDTNKTCFQKCFYGKNGSRKKDSICDCFILIDKKDIVCGSSIDDHIIWGKYILECLNKKGENNGIKGS